MIRIAITKGRIEKDICEIFKKAGIPVEDIINKERKLLIKSKINDIDVEYVFVKSSDVITLIKYGKVDIGFVGKDTLSENRFKEYYELLDLNVGKCYFALASYPEYEDKKYKDKK